jgi:hypothetical protein
MTLNQLTEYANSYTDENFSTSQTIIYANTAISKINTNLKSTLPLFNPNPAIEYTDLEDSWLMLTVLPYICWSIKMNDGSLNEAGVYLFEFQNGMRVLNKNKKTAIPENRQAAGFKTVYQLKNYSGMVKTTSVVSVDSNSPLGEDE